MKALNSSTIHFLLIVFFFFTNVKEPRCENIDANKNPAEIKNFLENATDISTIDFQKAITQATNGLNLAHALHDNNLIFFAYRTLGIINEDNNHLIEALNWFGKALSIEIEQSNSFKLDIYLDWAIINKKLSNYQTTKEYYQKALDLAININDLEIIECVYTGLGTLNGSIGEFDTAIEFHLLSKEIAEKRKHTEGVINANVNIAVVYNQAKNYKLAYTFLKFGYDIVLSTKDSVRLDYVLNAYGQVLNAEKRYNEAIFCHIKALKYCESSGDKWMISRTLGFMADVYTQTEQYNNAEKAFNRCFEYSSYFDFYDHPNLYLSLGNFYLKTKKLNQAADAFHKSLNMSLKRGFQDLVQKSNLGLAEVYEQLGNYDASIKYIKVAEMYKDSIFNEDKSKKIAEVQYKYNKEKSEIEDKINLEKSEKEIQALRLSQNQTILYLLFVVLFVLFTFIFIFYYVKQKNKNNTLLSQKNIEIELKNDRLEKSNEILKQFAYASAHDLKEPLRSISSFVSIINSRYAKLLPPEASEYMNFVIVGVKRMESLISALLEYSTVATDVEEITQATSLSKVLNDMNDKFYNLISEKNAKIELNGYLPLLEINRLHLTKLFQNLLLNAIKFNDKNPIIQIKGRLENELYIVEVKDNGIGIKLEYNDKIFRLFQRLSRSAQYDGMGMGLAICKQIVDRYDGSIRFESVENEGTTFILSFPAFLIEKEVAQKEKVRKEYRPSQAILTSI